MSPEVRAGSSRGQTLVIVAIGMVVLVGMVGLVIDGGIQWASNRGSQNGSDATAEAGAIVLMQHILGTTKTDGDVLSAVNAAAAKNEIDVEIAEYVYFDTTATDDPWATYDPSIEVGSGTIPADAQGVRVVGTRVHETLFARVLGIEELAVFTDAVAVTGPADPCPPGGPCAFLPVTIPTTQVTCDGQNKSVATELEWTPTPVEWVIPLCGNNPGSVGWIDWTPPAGGNSELAAELCAPNPPSITLPDWFYVTSTGNTNASTVQDCFEIWIDDIIMIPLFEDTCASDPGDVTECTDPAPIGGVNQWYYFPRAAAILLTGVYIAGNHADVCDTGNGATSCITGQFVDTAITGEVTGPFDPTDPSLSQFFAVQLVR